MRRVTRAAAVALAGGALVAPWAMHAALAAPSITVTPPDLSKVSGAVTIHASSSGQNGSVSSWTVQIAENASQPQFATVTGCTTSATTVDCPWDTTKVLGSTALAPNDKYIVRVTARDSGSLTAQPQTYMTTVNLFVQNAPAAPANFIVTRDEAAARINVSWNANPEPDIKEYTLRETLPDSSVKVWHILPPCGSSACTFSRQYTVGGTYSYTVTAVRNATNPDGTATTLSSPATGPKQTTVADPNPTTTTTTTTRPAATTTTGGGSGGSGGGTSGGGYGGSGSSGSSGGSDSFSGVVVNGFRIERIASGDPGTVGSTANSSGRVVTLGGGDSSQEADGGYNQTLPYQKPKQSDQPQNIAQAIANIPSRVFTDDSTRRAALSVTAAGMLLFVFAMQVRFVTKRAAES